MCEPIGAGKQKLELRFHQKLIIKGVMRAVNNGYKNMLVAAKPRSGKSYIIGGIALHFKNVLLLSTVPSETFSQFMNDLFLKFVDFSEYKIHNPLSSHELRQMKLGDMNIIIISKQLLQMFVLKNKLRKLLNMDAILFDESHYGGVSSLAKEVVKSYSGQNTVHVYVTATYKKVVESVNIDKIFYWSIKDEQLCKKRDVDGLISRHGAIVKSVLKDVSELDVYKIYPDMMILSTLHDKRIINKLKQILKIKTYNIPMNILFQNKWAIQALLDYIVSIYKRINFISNKYNSKTNISEDNFTIQLWFLPPAHVNETSNLLVKLCLEHPIFSKFGFFIINSQIEDVIEDVKSTINTLERKYKREKKMGLIILSGNMLSIGISLRSCHYVFMLNNINNVDKITQSIFRSMTESQGKKFGFVIDLNINRLIEAMLTYSTEGNTIENRIKYLVNNKIIFVDVDVSPKNDIIRALFNNYVNDPVNEYQQIIRFQTQIIPVLKYIISSLSNDKTNIYIKTKIVNAMKYSLVRVNRLINYIIDNIELYDFKMTSVDVINGIYDLSG